MSTKEFNTFSADLRRDYAAEMQELVGANMPISIRTNVSGELEAVTFETEWKEGTTEPVLDEDDKVIGYKENYTSQKLDRKKVKKLEAYIDENLKTK